MTLSYRTYDRAWNVIAFLSIVSVILISRFSLLSKPWSYGLLGSALLASTFLALFVKRVAEAVPQETHTTESAEIDFQATSSEGLAIISHHHATPNDHPYIFSLLRAATLHEQTLESAMSISKFRDQENRDVLSLYKLSHLIRKEQRRNVLEEARELARHMTGTNLAVHISPNSEIAICERMISREWPTVTSVEQTSAEATITYLN